MNDELKRLLESTQREVEEAMRSASGCHPIPDYMQRRLERAFAAHKAACKRAQDHIERSGKGPGTWDNT
jgi:hypothetical protein